MGWYSDLNAWAAKVSNRISKRHRRIAASVLMLCWGAGICFRWPVEPVFFFIIAFQLAFTSLFMKDQIPESTKKSRATKAR
ncbi:hypothetical protein AEQ67_13825 [Pseudomonas sp. RIT-PI-q]|nr:hypothetical protein AEQ67_13825 [Pseudomonas sp. RIT-PI-q]